jgi:hypothetical protein
MLVTSEVTENNYICTLKEWQVKIIVDLKTANIALF